ncbi:alpha/beta fold hydrolase [Membranicola marinus]|uniref:Alpha/beta fold hydrolase n=1 Tax=Membranihabitans marinus TaxID=1227546 RepID=A0A953HZD1_9BACT|nr:alpha/beta fold hydrolase [Membranihabitans marinus]MBY5959491.1 alpha/beta fold hydrolase [Membranihabitans marinus]
MTRYLSLLFIRTLVLLGICTVPIIGQEGMSREDYLQQLLKVLPEDRTRGPNDQLPGTPPPHVSPEDVTWGAWLKRTGELPPDFDKLPTLPFLPNPLILDEGGKNIPVTTMAQWQKKRTWMTDQAQHWITGTVPPPPDNLQIEMLSEKKRGELTERTVLLKFGPKHQAQLHVNLIIPPGDGPFPVFICPWKKEREDWVQAAVRRGYIGCRFTATDPKYGFPDDSEKYEALWWPEFDFSTIMRWGWAASRAIDYLYTLENVHTDQIALTGLSRNGKMALWAAAYDNRIKAVVPISGGTGGENPFRYTMAPYNSETVELLTRYRPHWLHPRLRFFVGRENKLPVDMNSLMALVAPRGLMLTSSAFESAGNPWGIEQAYLSAKEAYKFLGAENHIAIDLRNGLHAPSARDMERYIDFFDYVFDRGDIKSENKLFYDYTFSKWLGLSDEMIDPLSFPQKGIDDLLLDSNNKPITDTSSWNTKAAEIKKQIRWGLGQEPPSLGPGEQPDYLRDAIGFPKLGTGIDSKPFLFGQLYYPSDKKSEVTSKKIPVIIYLHEFAYSTGSAKVGRVIREFVNEGFAVFIYDQIGFGTRVEEGRLFYERFPNWSKLGRMVADVRWSVDALAQLDFIDANQIYAAGYSLGGTVGLYSAALDKRIAGVISVGGFTPMRTDTVGKTAEGIYKYSHLHGLQPRLGFFIGEEARIPYDFHEILASIAPRPLFVIAPTWDQYAAFSDVEKCMGEVTKIYDLFGAQDHLQFYAPKDYSRWSDEINSKIIAWLEARLNE